MKKIPLTRMMRRTKEKTQNETWFLHTKAAVCFGGVVVAVDTVLRSLKGKILRINKSWVQNSLRYESKM